MTLSLRLAFFCGGIPLLFGTAIFLTWLATGWGWWERAWVWAIGVALICIVVGFAALARHMQRPEHRQRWAGPAVAVMLLLLNFPLGMFYMWVVVDLSSRYTVEIQNQSPQQIDRLVLTGAGIRPVELGPIPTGVNLREHLRPHQDGKLRFTARQGTNEFSGIFENSAGAGSGGQKTIRVARDGSWQVLHGLDR